MFDQRDVQMVQERHNDLRREAERLRLVQLATGAGESGSPFYYTTLAAFGRGLSALGNHLQNLYSDVYTVDAPVTREAR